MHIGSEQQQRVHSLVDLNKFTHRLFHANKNGQDARFLKSIPVLQDVDFEEAERLAKTNMMGFVLLIIWLTTNYMGLINPGVELEAGGGIY